MQGCFGRSEGHGFGLRHVCQPCQHSVSFVVGGGPGFLLGTAFGPATLHHDGNGGGSRWTEIFGSLIAVNFIAVLCLRQVTIE